MTTMLVISFIQSLVVVDVSMLNILWLMMCMVRNENDVLQRLRI